MRDHPEADGPDGADPTPAIGYSPSGRRPHPRMAALLLMTVAIGACGSAGAPVSTATTVAAPSPTATTPPRPAGGTASGVPVAPESSPPGDIPDTVAYVTWASSDHRVRFAHPEGWSQVAVTGGVQFSDKLNSITLSVAPGRRPSVAEARSQIAPTLGGPGRATRILGISPVQLRTGAAVQILWQVNSLPNPVTGRTYRDDVVSYLVGAAGRVVRLDLSGTVGSDNVDPYRKITDSLVVS